VEDFPSCFVGPKLVDIRISWPIFKFCIIGNGTVNLVNNANVATLPLHTSRIHVDSKSWFTGMEESISFTQKGRAFLLMFAAEFRPYHTHNCYLWPPLASQNQYITGQMR
jgi:hypothetical protein